MKIVDGMRMRLCAFKLEYKVNAEPYLAATLPCSQGQLPDPDCAATKPQLGLSKSSLGHVSQTVYTVNCNRSPNSVPFQKEDTPCKPGSAVPVVPPYCAADCQCRQSEGPAVQRGKLHGSEAQARMQILHRLREDSMPVMI